MQEYDFKPFARAVYQKFQDISTEKLFSVKVPEDELWETYLKSFPEGSNPIHVKRTEHDCSCCRHFIRRLGNVVTIKDGKVISIWDDLDLKYPYSEVASSLSEYVHSLELDTIFRTKEGKIGQEQTRQILESGDMIHWNHFFADIPKKFRVQNPDATIGHWNTRKGVFERGLRELKLESLDDVIDLIQNNQLYRGEEHLQSVLQFREVKSRFDQVDGEDAQKLFIYETMNMNISNFKNSVIGTLVEDLSSGRSLNAAVGSFEAKVAPQNYKRPKALITKKMVENAMKTIEKLNIRDSVERRLTRIEDLSVNNVLWVSNEVKPLMKDSLVESLMSEVKSKVPKNMDAEKIKIEKFLEDVIPDAQSVELMVKNDHASNFVTLTSPLHEDSKPLFKWDNGFAWSYRGGVTDSIEQRVKAAGGNIDAKLRFSLAWHNSDDLDIHLRDPHGNHIYYGNKRGFLDVDMNAGGRMNEKDPVENISFVDPMDGVYTVWVENYFRRNSKDSGFTIEYVDVSGNIRHATSPHSPNDSESFNVGRFTVENGFFTSIDIEERYTHSGYQTDIWGVKTEEFTKVKFLMLSPNHWDDKSQGNKHWFFILDGCSTKEPVRGIYNEFLRGDLNEHRKVFEMIGEKTKCEYSKDQLSGLGFSSTKSKSVIAKVGTDSRQKLYEIQF